MSTSSLRVLVVLCAASCVTPNDVSLAPAQRVSGPFTESSGEHPVPPSDSAPLHDEHPAAPQGDRTAADHAAPPPADRSPSDAGITAPERPRAPWDRPGPQTWQMQCAGDYGACLTGAPKTVTCPATRAEISPGATCGIESLTAPQTCVFGESRCRCLHHGYCGGPTPTMVQQHGMTWECGPVPGPGDCPDTPPVAGTKCSTRQECTSGGCGTSNVCRCVKERWVCETRYWAPPP